MVPDNILPVTTVFMQVRDSAPEVDGMEDLVYGKRGDREGLLPAQQVSFLDLL